MKSVKKLLTVALLSALSLIVGCESISNKTLDEPALPDGVYQKELLLADFDELVETFVNRHPKTFTNLDEFESVRALQRNKITDMSEYEFFKVLAPVVERMNCGHTFINYSVQQNEEVVNSGNFFPFDVKVIGKELYVVNEFAEDAVGKGAIIHTINGQNVSDIIDKIYNLYTTDGQNLSAKEAKINAGYNAYPSFNIAYHTIIGSPDTFNISYSYPNNKEVIETTISARSHSPQVWKNTMLRFSYEDNYAILTVPHFHTYQVSEFRYFSKRLDKFFSGLKKKGIENLILDLRGNGGGDPNAGNLLLTYLLRSPFQYFNDNITGFYVSLTQDSQLNNNAFDGELVILIDGLGFSTTGHVLSHLVDQSRGTFIGQESGAGYICNDASEVVKLKNTKISFNVPSFAFSTSVKGQPKGRGIMPDIGTKYSIENYLNNTDLEMQSALDLIQN